MLSIEDHEQAKRHTLLLSGELDIASAPELEARVQQLCSQGQGELVLDLGGLEFIDSAGINAILRARSLCGEHMWELCLAPGERPVQRLFELTRLIDRLPFKKARKEQRAQRSQQASRADAEPDA
jgi:anti-sigma B factor antagonist